MRSKLGLTVLAVLSLVTASACSGSGRGATDPSLPQTLDTRSFRHDQHLALEVEGRKVHCELCHRVNPEEAYRAIRPGAAEHAPCDTCHAAEFMKPPGAFCKVCHVSVDPLQEGQSPLGEYPRQEGRAQLIASFNHKTHIERAGDRIKEGGEFACEACHQVKETSPYASFPNHAECSFCHAEVARPKMRECEACHVGDGPTKERLFVTNDIRFTHGKHRMDAAGMRIPCVTCHGAVLASTKSSEMNLPQMRDCAVCHEDSSRTPDRVRIAKCGVCHISDVESVALPGSHTP